METNESLSTKHSVQTASGRISYTEQGMGPVALFVHGVLLNGHLWRHQQAELSDIRRTIAVDLLAHGDTEIAPDQDVSVTANAIMLNEFLDALNIDCVDLVGNDNDAMIADAIDRAHAYAEAGADGLFAPGLVDIALIGRLAKVSRLPLNIMVGDTTPHVRSLAEHGVARVSHGPGPYLMAMKALEEAARAVSA